MDPLVDNDTWGLHWTLKPSESRRLLAALFPDRKLFQTSVELLPAASSNSCSEMIYIFEKLREGDYYGNAKDEDTKGKDSNTMSKDKNTKGKGKNTKGTGRNTKGTGRNTKGTGKNTKGTGSNTKENDTVPNKKDSEYWLDGPLAIKSEHNMASFLNGIMDAVEEAMGGKFLNRQ